MPFSVSGFRGWARPAHTMNHVVFMKLRCSSSIACDCALFFFFFFCSIFQCLVNAPPLARVGALMSCVAAILPDPPSPLCRRTVSPPRPKVYADLHRGAFTCLSPVVLPLLHEENLSVLR